MPTRQRVQNPTVRPRRRSSNQQNPSPQNVGSMILLRRGRRVAVSVPPLAATHRPASPAAIQHRRRRATVQPVTAQRNLQRQKLRNLRKRRCTLVAKLTVDEATEKIQKDHEEARLKLNRQRETKELKIIKETQKRILMTLRASQKQQFEIIRNNEKEKIEILKESGASTLERMKREREKERLDARISALKRRRI